MKKTLLLVGICLLAAMLLQGCLDGDKTVIARYDKDKDAIHILTVWQNIRAQERNGSYDPAKDLAYLEKLYNNRDHLIFKPFEFLQSLGENGVLRLAGDRFANVDLGMASESKVEESPVELNKITILPGQFFLREPGNLCYYHQIIIPGAQIDQFFKATSDSLCESLAQAIDQENERRVLEGFVPDWDKYSKKVITTVEATMKNIVADGPEPENLDTYLPLSNDTLKRIHEAASKKKIVFTREGGVLKIAIPMTRSDAAKTVKLLNDVRETVKTQAKTLKPKDADSARQAVFLRKLAEVPQFDTMLDEASLSIDLADFINAFQAPMDPSRQLDKTQKDHAAELAKMAADRLPVNKTLTMESVVKHFQEGTLPANNADPAVKPGEGLQLEE